MLYELFIEYFTALLVIIYYVIRNTILYFIPFQFKTKKDISGDIILVTGAGNGIGKSLAKKLAKYGATLVLWDIEEEANKNTMNEIVESNGKAYAFKCDMSDKEDINKVAEEVKTKIGDVTMLINNAGIAIGKPLLELSDENIERIFKINAISHFWTTRNFLPSMLAADKGHIVSIASAAGMLGASKMVDYCSTKFSAVGFMDSLRCELLSLKKTDIKTTTVCPYFIKTRLCDRVFLANVPMIDLDYATDRIVEAILINQELLFIPKSFQLIVWMKNLFPTPAYDHISRVLLNYKIKDNKLKPN